MSEAVKLDQMRADMMDALYERSGRTCSTYTGLWQEFALDLAANFRDTDYEELVAKVCRAMDETGSVFGIKQARAAIEVCRQQLLGDKWR
jgi:hypothetical protein